MISYIGRRIVAILPLVLFAVLATFLLIRLSPVDPAESYFSAAHIMVTDELLAEKRHELGLDQPLLIQYTHTVANMLQLDFGNSYYSGQPVGEEIMKRLPATFLLALCSSLFTFLVVVVLGYLSAIYKNSWIDYLSRGLSYVGSSLPQFWLGYLLVFVFSIQLDWLPVEGRGGWQHMILPSATLSLALIAMYTRLFRESLLEQMDEAYVRYAKTRGIKRKSIMLRHVARIAIIPVITGLGMNIGRLLTGTIIVESVFSWPGLGRFFIESIFNRDVPVIQGFVFFAACLYLISSLVVDLIQMVLDPRISMKGRSDS